MIEENLTGYKSPRFDINGHPTRPYTVANNQNVIPPRHWAATANVKTRSEMMEKRKKEFLPSITYDIDGDGYVGHRDFALAKIFDRNNDGILDNEEREDMQKAVGEGAMKKYVWGLDELGANRHPRLIQKKGKLIVDGGYDDNRTPLASKTMPKTLTGLKAQAKEEARMQAETQINEWIQTHPTKLDYVPYRIYSEPKFKTINEKKKFLKKAARDKIGLDCPTELKISENDPKWDYVKNPPISSFQEFIEQRKQKKLMELHESKNYEHITREQKFRERESRYIYIIPESSDYMTSSKLLEKRKLDTNDYNLKTFSNPNMGIHGNELPKFCDNLQEYWKSKTGYMEDPEIKTRKELLTRQKLGKKDQYEYPQSLSAFGPPDGSKRIKKDLSKAEITEKPGNLALGGKFIAVECPEAMDNEKNQHDYRLSTIFGYFLKSNTVEHNTEEPVQHNEREKSRGSERKNTIIENLSPGQTAAMTTRPKSLIKKQGTSARILRSRGFLG